MFPSGEDMEIIEKSVDLIYFCPIIDQVDIDSIKQQCLKIKRLDLAEVICNVNV